MPIDANKGAPEDVLRRLKAASYERFRIELIKSIEKLLDDFEMSWDDLADKLCWPDEVEMYLNGAKIKRDIGMGILSPQKLNDIAHAFSMEPYLMFRPRFPYTQT